MLMEVEWSSKGEGGVHGRKDACQGLSFMYVCLFLRESVSEWGRGRERGRRRIRSRLQAPSCQHRAPRGARTHEPRDHDLMINRPRPSPRGAPASPHFSPLSPDITSRSALPGHPVSSASRPPGGPGPPREHTCPPMWQTQSCGAAHQ